MIKLSDDELVRLWDAVDQSTPYRWPVGQEATARLAEITMEVNGESSRDELSAVLGPMLCSDKRQKVAQWIVRDWGRIGRVKDESIADIVAGLDDYSDASIETFVNERRCERISCWSKLLAFQNGNKWAIYDSRTAVALNAALIKIGREPSFKMPDSRNTKIKPQRTKIAAHQPRGSALGYPEYLTILRALCHHRRLETIGAVEMVLFANAEIIVSDLKL